MKRVCGIAVVVVFLLTGCQQEPDSVDAQPTKAKVSAPTDAPTLDVVPGIQAITHTEDPREDGWRTEVFAQQALKQLNVLGQRLDHPASINADSLSLLCANDSACTALHPAKLTERFRDAGLVVHRMASDGQPQSQFDGPEGLVNALQQMIQSLQAVDHIHSKFKIVRVNLGTKAPRTHIYVQLAGHNDTQQVSMNATWNVTWSQENSQVAPLLKEINLETYEQVTVTTAQPLFADCTTAILEEHESFQNQLLLGVDHWTGAIDMRLGIDVGGWQGVTVGDVNGDGLDDVYVCQSGGLPNRLFVQNPDGTVTDRSTQSGADWLARSQAALLLDLDNDGDQDLVVSTNEGILVHANDGNGKFEVKLAKLLPTGVPYSLAAADYDQDSDLDIFVCCYEMQGGQSREVFPRAVPYHDANNGNRNVLLRNEGDLRFRQVTRLVGLDEHNQRFSYAAAWEDYDNDGDPDLYVANDFGRNNFYQNDAAKFRDIAADAGVEDIGAGMSACWGDYDNDGQMDLYVANMFSSAGGRIAFQKQFHPDANTADLVGLRRHARGNSLFRNLGNQRFEDVSVDAGVVMGRWAWGSKFVDINLDGWQDLLVANGFITQEDTGDL